MEDISLKQARLLREKTQDYMAELLGIHVQTYRKLEQNPDSVTIGQAKVISKNLGFPYDTIFFNNQLYLKQKGLDEIERKEDQEDGTCDV